MPTRKPQTPAGAAKGLDPQSCDGQEIAQTQAFAPLSSGGAWGLLTCLNPYAGLKVLPREMWWVALATFVNRAGTMVLPFLVLYLTLYQGLSAARAGGLLMVYGAAALVAVNVSGRLCDRIGAGRVMIGSLFLSSLVMLVFPLVHGFPALALAVAILSFFSEAFRPASLAIVPDLTTPDIRKQAFSLSRLAVNLGMSIGPAVGGLLAGWWFPAIFLVDGVSALLASGLLAWMFLRGPARPGGTREGTSEPGEGPAAHRNGRFRLFLLTTFLVGLAFFQLDAGMPLYMVEHLGLSERDFGLVFTVNTLLIILFELPLNARTARWAHRWSLALGCLLIGVGFGALYLVSSFSGVAATVVVWTVGEMILFPAQATYVAELAPAGREGEYMGLFVMSFSLAFTIGPGLGAYLLGEFGPALVWGGAFACGVLAAGAVLGLVRETS